MPISRAQSDFLKDGLHSREWQQAFWRPLPPALALTPVVPVVCSRFPLGHSRLLPICQKDTRLPSQSPSLQAPAFSHSSGSSSVIPKSSFSINQFYKVHLLSFTPGEPPSHCHPVLNTTCALSTSGALHSFFRLAAIPAS